jgi:diketogulonate reductase-like aldo/keto reductase
VVNFQAKNWSDLRRKKHGKVDANALIYAPGTNSANSIGFATVGAIMAEANSSLSSNGLTLSGDIRAYQETLKNALDNANNNKTFVQLNPCTFSFAL